MNDIDFLPQSYRDQRELKRRRVRRYTTTALVGVLIASWWLPLRSEVDAVQQHTDLLEQEFKAVQMVRFQHQQLQDQHNDLMHQVKLRSQMIDPVEVSGVLALLTELAPPEVKFDNVNLKFSRPQPELAETDSKKSRRKKKKDSPAEPYELTLEIDGFAPSDTAVVNMVSRIDEHPLFSSIKVPTNRDVNLQGLAARQFRLLLVVDLRRQIDTQPHAQGVAYVNP